MSEAGCELKAGFSGTRSADALSVHARRACTDILQALVPSMRLILCTFFAAALFPVGAVNAERPHEVAVLKFETQARTVSVAYLQAMTSDARRAAITTLPASRFAVLTDTEVSDRLDGNETLACDANGCVGIGQLLQVDYVLGGRVSKLGKRYRVDLELYDIERGRLLAAAKPLKSKSLDHVADRVSETVAELLKGPLLERANRLAVEKQIPLAVDHRNGVLACWGYNNSGQASPPTGSFTAIATGERHTCGIQTNGSVACWGNNDDGQLKPAAGSFTAIATGRLHTCAIETSGAVACWGNDVFGQSSPPTGSFAAIAAGGVHTCGIKTNGGVVCWGYDDSGQSNPPTDSFTAIAAGESHTCGIKTNGGVVCWGDNRRGQSRPPAGAFTATGVKTIVFTSIAAGERHTCGIQANGTAACWGAGTTSNKCGPATMQCGQSSPPTGSFAFIAAGTLHTCAIQTNGIVACWGEDKRGQSSPPTGSFAAIAAGKSHTCGISPSG